MSKEALLKKNVGQVSHFYFLMPGERLAAREMPPGQYLVSYVKNSYSDLETAYLTMFDYLENNHLMICGDAYEECLLDGLTSSNSQNYLTRVSIEVATQ